MKRTPFNKNVSLKAYINKGKDLNISENNISLIEHVLQQRYHDATLYYTMTRLVAQPNCIIDKNKIQSLLYKNYTNFQFSAIKSEEEKDAFINRFDFKNNILIAPNNGPYSREINYSIGWLQFFLLGQNSYHLFDLAKQYHKEYYDGFKITDNIGFNVWHTLLNSLTYMPNNNEIFNKINEKLKVLFVDYPEGLKHKNNANETPYEMIYRISINPEYSNHSNIKEALHVLKSFDAEIQYLELHSELKEDKQSNLTKRIKI